MVTSRTYIHIINFQIINKLGAFLYIFQSSNVTAKLVRFL